MILKMTKRFFLLSVAFLLLSLLSSIFLLVGCKNSESTEKNDVATYTGSESCKQCHERFYELWEPSHHGKAMQPITPAFVKENIVKHEQWEQVGKMFYKVVFEGDSIFFLESNEENGELFKKLPVVWALGGKNVYYFQTPWEGGRLQTLPLAYDINRNEWYNNPASGVRHFDDAMLQDSAVEWTHSLFTFNTTCHSCHVSQLEKNYDAENNAYHTIWKEPGINCETCHGPSSEHVKVCMESAKKNEVPKDLKLIVTSTFTPAQHNSSCAPCHAKMTPLTNAYPPGEDFYDHFNLTGLENPDFYPDGRDLGENYTMGTWAQNECAMNSDMHCVTCHTSSGRYRFKTADDPNSACASCHQDNGANFEKHAHHKNNGKVLCVSCHMPKTEFARMIRSDHSMRPPMPAATIEFGSPNACNVCHEDQSPEWANKHVTKWKGSDYQDETLYYGQLIKEGRMGNFDRMDDMIKMIEDHKPNAFFAASMVRILHGQNDERIWPVFMSLATQSKDPMLRAAAADGLSMALTNEALAVLLTAAQDSQRVVRVAAAAALSAYPESMFSEAGLSIRDDVFVEYKASMITSPDSWSAHYNLGNFESRIGETADAIRSFERASLLEPEVVGPYVNASLAHSLSGDQHMAEMALQKALDLEPNNSAVNVNYGLLMGEMSRFDEAKRAYLRALESDDQLVTAAYNLSVIYSQEGNQQAAIKYAGMASEIRPKEARYPYTYAFFLNQKGEKKKAIGVLEQTILRSPEYFDAYLLLERIYMDQGMKNAAKLMYSKAAKREDVSSEVKHAFLNRAAQFN